MIATREKPESVSSSIFDGLNIADLKFPEVPKNIIETRHTASETDSKEDTKTPSVEMQEIYKPVQTIAVTPPITSTTTATEAPKSKMNDLSTLYAAEVLPYNTSATRYPELPTFMHRDYSTVSNPLMEREEDERASLLTSAESSTAESTIAIDAPPSSEVVTTSSDYDSTALVDELVNEISRLQMENDSLRITMTQSDHMLAVSSSQGQKQSQMQIQRQSQKKSQVQKKSQTQKSQSQVNNTQTQSNTGTRGSAEATQKYVCCGRCHQWLLAPKEAMMVVCVTCQAVNNCNLVKPSANSTPVVESSGAVVPSGNWLWWLDCWGQRQQYQQVPTSSG
jgi:hypothetical protein